MLTRKLWKLNHPELLKIYKKRHSEKLKLDPKRLEHERKMAQRRALRYSKLPHIIKRELARRLKRKPQRLAYNHQKLYGLVPGGYEILLSKQSGKCAICLGTPLHKNRRLSIDHCHITKRIRGLLCENCNRGIGLFKDNSERLRKAASYLE